MIPEQKHVPFTPRWNNAQRCEICGELGLPEWQATSTARACANCGYIEERLPEVPSAEVQR